MEIITEILKFSVGGITIGAIVIFLGKIIINKSSDLILENHKNRLDILKTEHQIKFSQLHSERGQVIKRLYQNLFEIEKLLNHMTTLFQGTDWKYDREREMAAFEKIKETSDLIELNRIYFPEELCVKFIDTLNKFNNVISLMNEAKTKGKIENLLQGTQTIEGENSLEIWKKANESVEKDVKELKLKLAEDFRKIISP